MKMGYKLADDSLSTDYKIGDEFQFRNTNVIFVFTEEDNTECPWFKELGWGIKRAKYWKDLKPVKLTKHSALIKSIRETIQYLERIIKELQS